MALIRFRKRQFSNVLKLKFIMLTVHLFTGVNAGQHLYIPVHVKKLGRNEQ